MLYVIPTLTPSDKLHHIFPVQLSPEYAGFYQHLKVTDLLVQKIPYLQNNDIQFWRKHQQKHFHQKLFIKNLSKNNLLVLASQIDQALAASNLILLSSLVNLL